VSAIPTPGAVVTAMGLAAVPFFNETDSISDVQAPQLWLHHLHSFSLAPQPSHVYTFVKDICTYLLMIPFVSKGSRTPCLPSPYNTKTLNQKLTRGKSYPYSKASCIQSLL
jgi:hypothetical protein